MMEKPCLRKSFVLLEVTLSLVILSVTMTAVLRGFMLALDGARENAIIMKSSLLAQTLMEDYEIEPPDLGRENGAFEDDKRFGEEFENYFWERDVEEIDLRYDGFPRDPFAEELPLYELTLRVIYEDDRYRYVPFEVTTFLVEPTLFGPDAIQQNQLF